MNSDEFVVILGRIQDLVRGEGGGGLDKRPPTLSQ